MEEKVTKCSVSKKCGSCQYQGVPYKEQLAAKQKGRVRKSKKAQQKETYLRYKNEALCGCRPPEEARAILTEMQIEELCTLADEAFLKG